MSQEQEPKKSKLPTEEEMEAFIAEQEAGDEKNFQNFQKRYGSEVANRLRRIGDSIERQASFHRLKVPVRLKGGKLTQKSEELISVFRLVAKDAGFRVGSFKTGSDGKHVEALLVKKS